MDFQQTCIHENRGAPCVDVRCDQCPFRYTVEALAPTPHAADAFVDDYIPPINWETRLPPRVEGTDFTEALGRSFSDEPEQDEVRQFGGDIVDHPHHYARWVIEPVAFIAQNNMPWWAANVVKYIMRYDAKDGLKDLYKARSYLDMKIRQLEGHPRFWDKPVGEERRLNQRMRELTGNDFSDQAEASGC